jgi:Flp pilus assembly pilin Flp
MFQRTPLHRRRARDEGATAVEYGLILGGVVLATALSVVGLRSVMKSALQQSSGQQAVLTTGVTATP